MKVGDLVLKHGDLDKGKIGLILKIKTNSNGYTFIDVLKSSGDITTWYIDTVKLI